MTDRLDQQEVVLDKKVDKLMSPTRSRTTLVISRPACVDTADNTGVAKILYHNDKYLNKGV